MKAEMKVRIGKELLKLRIDNDMSIKDLSNKSKVNKDTIYRYENGHGNRFDTLQKILDAYNLNLSIFFTKIYDSMQNKWWLPIKIRRRDVNWKTTKKYSKKNSWQ